jgi:hypothetical protein
MRVVLILILIILTGAIIGCKTPETVQAQAQAQAPQVMQQVDTSMFYINDTKRHKHIGSDGHTYIRHNNTTDIYVHLGGCPKCKEDQIHIIDSIMFKYIIGSNYDKADTTQNIKRQIDSLQNLIGVKK